MTIAGIGNPPPPGDPSPSARTGPGARSIRPARPGSRTAIATALLILAAMAAGLSWWRLEPGEARRAREAIRAGRHDEAGEALAGWLAAAPDSAEAHLLKGRLAAARDRIPEAAEELRLAQGPGRDREGLALLRAIILAKIGRQAEAEPDLRRAFLGDRPPDRQVDEALARVYLETFDLPRAVAVLDRWAGDFPDDPRPHLWRAEVHGRSAEGPGSVMEDYRQALRRDPSLGRARLGLAEELLRAHRNDEAATEFDAYLASHPDDAAAHLGAGRNLMELGDDGAAARHLERSMALDPGNAETHEVLAEAAIRRGEWPAALAILDRAVALGPFDLAVRSRRGLVLSRLGRDDEARAERAVADRLRADLDRLDRARSKLVRSPGDRDSQIEIARWMFGHGQEREGARWAGRILVEHPDDPEASGLLADYHRGRGEKGLANFYRSAATSSHQSPAGTR